MTDMDDKAFHYKKDFDSYGTHMLNDFVADQELTTTITLSEYRELVKKDAISSAKIEAANDAKYEAGRERDKCMAENAELKSKLFDLQEELRNKEPDFNVVVKDNNNNDEDEDY